MSFLTTSRLRLRPLIEEDFPFMYRLQSDPVVMRFIRAAATEEAPVRERMAIWLRYGAENPGFGVFLIEAIDSDQAIGHGVFRHADYKPGRDIEVGYVIAPEFAGQGLATECVQGMQAHAVEKLNLEKLVAYTDPENAASNRVLEKCGFVRDGLEEIYDGISQRWLWRKTSQV